MLRRCELHIKFPIKYEIIILYQLIMMTNMSFNHKYHSILRHRQVLLVITNDPEERSHNEDERAESSQVCILMNASSITTTLI